MSKEQTPIGYLFNGRFYKTIEDLRGKTMSEDNQPQPLFTESQCNAKVLEALDEKSKTAESILGTLNDMHSNDEISYDRYTYLFDKVASIQLDETEVKPKYKQINK